MCLVLDPVLLLALVVAAALLGGAAAVRFKQRAVVGELIAGIILGNLPLVGVHALSALPRDPFLDALARLGVILLLFEIGHQSTVAEMRRIGVRSLAVALLGVTNYSHMCR
jgi:Kef-type K+ transport system membrane component KefB